MRKIDICRLLIWSITAQLQGPWCLAVERVWDWQTSWLLGPDRFLKNDFALFYFSTATIKLFAHSPQTYKSYFRGKVSFQNPLRGSSQRKYYRCLAKTKTINIKCFNFPYQFWKLKRYTFKLCTLKGFFWRLDSFLQTFCQLSESFISRNRDKVYPSLSCCSQNPRGMYVVSMDSCWQRIIFIQCVVTLGGQC